MNRTDTERLVTALERIATALERDARWTIVPTPVELKVDGKTLANAVVQYTLRRSARGPSSLLGGTNTKD